MRFLVPLINGFEEIEAVSVIDVLRRAGLEVVTAGMPGSWVTGDNGIKLMADCMLKDVDPSGFDGLVLPGGSGAKLFHKSDNIMSMIRDFNEKEKLICAICYSPVILSECGVLKDRRATVYPGQERHLPKPRSDRVVEDGHVITSQGPGTAVEFGLRIVEKALGRPKAESLRKGLVCR